jgi:hypothetical protein
MASKVKAASGSYFYLTPHGVQSFEDLSDLEDGEGRIVIEVEGSEPFVLERVTF